MDRARDFHFVKQLPRHNLEEVHYEECVYDHQVLLNETWHAYAMRRGYGAERAGEEHVKWVTETWEQYEARCIQREAALKQYFDKQRKLQADKHNADADRLAISHAVVADMVRREQRLADARNQPIHTLLLDFDQMMGEKMRRERADLEAAELKLRARIAKLEEEERRAFEVLAVESLKRVLEILEKQRRSREEEEKRLREEQLRKADELRAADERKKREAEEAERRRKEAEEEARRAERKRKDEERKAKARAEREARTAAARGQTHSQKKVEDRWKTCRIARVARQDTEMQAYLDALRERAAAVKTNEELQALYAAVVSELGGGGVLFNTAVYMGALADTLSQYLLKYVYASVNCSNKLRSGAATLTHPRGSAAESADVPMPLTIMNCVVEGQPTGVVRHCMNTLVNIGDLQIPHNGDYFASPIICTRSATAQDGSVTSTSNVVAVLACDTLQGNPHDDLSTLHPGEEDCYNTGDVSIGDDAAAVQIPEKMATFMTQVAGILSNTASNVANATGDDAQQAVQQKKPPVGAGAVKFPDTFPSVHSLFTFATNAAFQARERGEGQDPSKSGIHCYVSRNNCSNGTECTVIAHNGVSLTDPARHTINDRPCHLLGLALTQASGCLTLNDLRAVPRAAREPPQGQRAIDAASDREIIDSCPHAFVKSVAADNRCKAYVQGAGKSPEEALLLVPINDQKNAHIVSLGFSGRADLFDEATLAAMLRIALKTREALIPLLVDMAVQEMCNQALEWLTNTTGCTNAYVSLLPRGAKAGDASSMLTYVAATAPQQWLIGRTMDPANQETFSYKLIQQSIGEKKPLLANVPAVRDAPNIVLHNDALNKATVEGSLLAKPIGTGADDIHGVLYADTVHSGADFGDGKKKKTIFEKGDEEMMNITAMLLGEVLNETRSGKPIAADSAASAKKLSIESVAGEERIKFLKLVWLKITSDVKAITNNQLQEMKSYNAPPPVIPTSTSAMFIVLGTKPKSVEKWEDTRTKIHIKLLDKIAAFDPTSTKIKKAFFMRAKKMTKGYTAHDIFTKGSYPASCFFTWTFVTIVLRTASDRLRKRIKDGSLWEEDGVSVGEGVSTIGADTEALNEDGMEDLGDDEGVDVEEGDV